MKCPQCNGAGKVLDQGGATTKCQDCEGTGEIDDADTVRESEAVKEPPKDD